jgi:Mn-dependent DtxR family transcriptional regulator
MTTRTRDILAALAAESPIMSGDLARIAGCTRLIAKAELVRLTIKGWVTHSVRSEYRLTDRGRLMAQAVGAIPILQEQS